MILLWPLPVFKFDECVCMVVVGSLLDHYLHDLDSQFQLCLDSNTIAGCFHFSESNAFFGAIFGCFFLQINQKAVLSLIISYEPYCVMGSVWLVGICKVFHWLF